MKHVKDILSLGHRKFRVLVHKLSPYKVPWNPQVVDVEMLLQISFGSMNTNLITPCHNGIVDIDCKNEKADLNLLHEHDFIGKYDVKPNVVGRPLNFANQARGLYLSP